MPSAARRCSRAGGWLSTAAGVAGGAVGTAERTSIWTASTASASPAWYTPLSFAVGIAAICAQPPSPGPRQHSHSQGQPSRKPSAAPASAAYPKPLGQPLPVRLGDDHVRPAPWQEQRAEDAEQRDDRHRRQDKPGPYCATSRALALSVRSEARRGAVSRAGWQRTLAGSATASAASAATACTGGACPPERWPAAMASCKAFPQVGARTTALLAKGSRSMLRRAVGLPAAAAPSGPRGSGRRPSRLGATPGASSCTPHAVSPRPTPILTSQPPPNSPASAL